MANHIMNKHIIAYDNEQILPPKKRSFFFFKENNLGFAGFVNELAFTMDLKFFHCFPKSLSLCKFNHNLLILHVEEYPNNLHRFGIVDPYLLTLNLSDSWLWVE